MQRDWQLVFGGGAGDVWWEFLNTVEPQRIQYLVENHGCRIRVLSRCHNPGVADVFRFNPYVYEHVVEDWKPPCPEDHQLFNAPTADGFWPLQCSPLFYQEAGGEAILNRVELYLGHDEKRLLAQLMDSRPCIVAHPFAGLSDRDAFNESSFRALVEDLVVLEPRVRVLVLGHNHNRTHKYHRESVLPHPNVVDLIDKVGLRLGYHLTKHADAFVGSHSNLIRAAWMNRRRNACVIPAPMMTDHWAHLDKKYTYGTQFPETRLFTFPFGEGVERDFAALDTRGLASFLLGRS